MASSTLILKKRMKHVVIPGGGLIGLYTLHKLTQAKVKSVTIIEPRNEFDREGDLVPAVVSDMGKSVGFKLEHCGAFRICDIQKSLYAKANKDAFKSASFTSFNKGKAVVEDGKHQKTELDCDLLLDCSGTNRVGIQAVNAIQPNFFTTRDAGIHSLLHYMFVQITLDARDIALWDTFTDSPENLHPDFANQFRHDKFLKLRKLGWKKYSIPFHYLNDYEHPTYKRIHLYTEAPDELKDPAKQAEWVMTLAQLAIGYDKISLKICNKADSKELAISHYPVHPKRTTPAYFPGNQDAPAMFHHCDATFNMPNITGASLEQGMFRVDHFIKSMTVDEKSGEITEINLTNYLKMFDESMKVCVTKTEGAYMLLVDRYHIGRREYTQYIWKTFLSAKQYVGQKEHSERFDSCCETLKKALDTDAPLEMQVKQEIQIFLQEFSLFTTIVFHKDATNIEATQGTAPTPGNLIANGKS